MLSTGGSEVLRRFVGAEVLGDSGALDFVLQPRGGCVAVLRAGR